MSTKIQLRRDTKLNWETTNPVLSQGEPGLESDTFKIKHGDGTTPWNGLPYMIEGDKTATTGSNIFVGDQTINGDLNVHDINLYNALYVIDGVNNSGLGNTATVTGYIDPLRDLRILSFQSGGPIVVGMTVQGPGVNSGVTITALPGAGGLSIGTYKINGQLTKVGSKYSPVTFTIGYPQIGESYITGSLVWDLDGNYWKAGVSGSEVQVANVDYVDEVNTLLLEQISASFVTTASFNLYTSSYSASQSTINNAQSVRLTSLESNTGSYALTTNVNTLSPSFNTRIIAATNEQNISNLVTTSSFNSFTSSYYIDSASAFTTRTSNALSITSLNTFTSSFSASQYTINNTQSSRLGTLETFTSSYYIDSASAATIRNTNILNIASLTAATSSYETKGRGIVSGSSQLTSSYDTRYVLSGSITQTTWDNIANKPAGIISSSTQLTTLATTGSNTFIGNQTITGSLVVSSSSNVNLITNALLVGSGSGDEGGEIRLAKAVTNTTLTGSSVVVDIFQNKLRIFEESGTNRGGYFDISSFAAGVGTNLAGNAVTQSITNSMMGVTTKTGATGTVVHDCTSTSVFYHTAPAANFTVNFTGLGLTANKYRQIKLVILQGGTNRVPTAVQIDGTPVTVSFKGNTGHNNLTDICTFDIINNNGTYIVLADIYGGY